MKDGKLFMEERMVTQSLLARWYKGITRFTEIMDGIFSEKGKLYDRKSPVWHRIHFPHGFVQELRKKTDRIDQLLTDWDGFPGDVNWVEVQEELIDVANYARMFGALIDMVKEQDEQTSPQVLENLVQDFRDILQAEGK